MVEPEFHQENAHSEAGGRVITSALQWKSNPCDPDRTAVLESELGLSREAAILMRRLGYTDPEEGRAFLDPRLQSLDDPFRITNMDRAVTRVRAAMSRAEDILVFGDYDVDGVTSTAFLVDILKIFGVTPRFVVPKRLEEGYGLSMGALDRSFQESTRPQLVIAVDCGTNSLEEVAWLRQKGVDIVIIDHHTSKEKVPADTILVNPHVFDSPSEPWANLCTVGLVFKFVHALLKDLRSEGDDLALQIRLKDYLDLAALGTLADLVPLTGENRILAKSGLAHLRETQRTGLNALFSVCGMRLGNVVSPFDISFRLGPRINASGRLADAALPIDLLLSNDWQNCLNIARTLDEFNRERQDIEREIVREAERMVAETQNNAPGIVLYHPDWHPGVVGIVASRISKKYHRPCLVLGAESDLAKGSGRSVAGIDLVEALTPCAWLLEHWGGHPAAVGVSARPENLDALRDAFCSSILSIVSGEIAGPEIEIACWSDPAALTERLLAELERLAPFGQGNPEPVFGVRKVVLDREPVAFGKGHYRFQIETAPGTRIQGVAWKQADRPIPAFTPVDLALRFAWNHWNGRSTPQVSLVDWRPAAPV